MDVAWRGWPEGSWTTVGLVPQGAFLSHESSQAQAVRLNSPTSLLGPAPGPCTSIIMKSVPPHFLGF